MAGMDVTFRYNGAGADVANAIPPGFAFTVLPDGFMVTVPVGYTVHVNPLYPPILQVVGGGQVPNPVVQVPNPIVQVPNPIVQVPNPINPVVRIMQASANRILTQSEVLHLLQHDTLQLLPRVVRKPRSGLFMYPMDIIRQKDTHKYNGNHITYDVPVGDLIIKYRWSLAGTVTARRYHLVGGQKFLFHYLAGRDYFDDGNDPVIPVNPVLQLN